MKTLILCALVAAMCLSLEVQGNCNYEGMSLTPGKHSVKCVEYTCHPDGHITGLTCAEYRCAEGKQIGYRQNDLSKSYPQCCGGPICAD